MESAVSCPIADLHEARPRPRLYIVHDLNQDVQRSIGMVKSKTAGHDVSRWEVKGKGAGHRIRPRDGRAAAICARAKAPSCGTDVAECR